MAIISTILSQMWTIYIHSHALTGAHRDTDRIWKTGVRFDFYHICYCLIEFKFSTGFISFQLVDVFACMFWNAFHTWCECKRKEMTLHTRFGDDEKIKRKKKTSLCIHSATEIESKILLITCLHFFPVEHAINSKQDRHGKAKAINYIRMLMVPLTRIFAD